MYLERKKEEELDVVNSFEKKKKSKKKESFNPLTKKSQLAPVLEKQR